MARRYRAAQRARWPALPSRPRGRGPGLVGEWANSQFTVEDLDYIIRTTMPKGSAGQMASDDYTAVLTYILQQNGYEAGATTPLRAGSPRMKQARLRFGIAKELAAAPPPLRVTGDASAVPKGGGPTQEELIRAAESTLVLGG